jgi:hypothetical protein
MRRATHFISSNMCEHISWLRLAGEDNLYLYHNNRLAQVARQLAYPATQYPSLTVFLGRKSRETALRQLYRNFRKRRQDAFLNLRLDAATYGADHPSLVADGDLRYLAPPIHAIVPLCHEEEMLHIGWQAPPQTTLVTMLYVRLMLLFADVVCIFADDYGGLEAVAQMLRSWIAIGRNTLLPGKVRPTILVVTTEPVSSVTQEVLDDAEFQEMLGEESLSAQDVCFAPPRVVRISSAVTPGQEFAPLKHFIDKTNEEVREIRKGYQLLFTIPHLEALFAAAVRQFAPSVSVPFNFVWASRLENPVSEACGDNLGHFINLAKSLNITRDLVLDYIASAIVMDAYPPGMHGR